jgi:hypothetical protein
MVVEIRYVEDHHVRVALRHGNSEQRREGPWPAESAKSLPDGDARAEGVMPDSQRDVTAYSQAMPSLSPSRPRL